MPSTGLVERPPSVALTLTTCTGVGGLRGLRKATSSSESARLRQQRLREGPAFRSSAAAQAHLYSMRANRDHRSRLRIFLVFASVSVIRVGVRMLTSCSFCLSLLYLLIIFSGSAFSGFPTEFDEVVSLAEPYRNLEKFRHSV